VVDKLRSNVLKTEDNKNNQLSNESTDYISPYKWKTFKTPNKKALEK
jgi:hypothetical protein